MNKLEQTASLMSSTDYKDQFIAEYQQLKIRHNELVNMLDEWRRNVLEFEPKSPRSIYYMQVRFMEDYITVLEARAKIEGIILPEV